MNQFVRRRQQLFQAMKDNSFVVVFAGNPVRKSADSDFKFEANRNYYYLTGLSEPSGVLLLAKTKRGNREFLFIRDINYDREKWIGRFISPDKAMKVSGIDGVSYVSAFEGFFLRQLQIMEIETVGIDSDRQSFDSRPLEGQEFGRKLRKAYPTLPLYDVYPIISKMRLIKDDTEIEAIKEAIQLTHVALESMVTKMKPGMKEYEIVAEFMHEVLKRNGTEMFDTIAASGENGVILHYVENDRTTEDGDLILFDLGAKLNHYGADISRTYPVNGKFNPRQKQIYNIVLDCHEMIIKNAKPKTTLGALNDLTKQFFVEELTKIGLISHPSELINYYYHSVSHFLGLDTHDVGQSENVVLEPGMVISNEPGLYIKEEKIGIRIETDLLITEDGCEDLAPMIKKTVEEIEALMDR